MQNGVQTAQSREVAENTAAGRNLGARVAATDPGDVLTYSLDDGADAAVVRHRQEFDRSTDRPRRRWTTRTWAIQTTCTQ